MQRRRSRERGNRQRRSGNDRQFIILHKHLRMSGQCIFSRRSREPWPTAAKPSIWARPRATSSYCRLPTPSSPRWRRRAGPWARRFPPFVSPTSCSSRTTPPWTSTARRSSPGRDSSSCACSAGSPTGPTGSSRSRRTCAGTGATLVLLPGDDQPDPELAAYSTVDCRNLPATVELPPARRRRERQELSRLCRVADRPPVRLAGAGRAATGGDLLARPGPPRPRRPAAGLDARRAGGGAGLLSSPGAGRQSRPHPGPDRVAGPPRDQLPAGVLHEPEGSRVGRGRRVPAGRERGRDRAQRHRVRRLHPRPARSRLAVERHGCTGTATGLLGRQRGGLARPPPAGSPPGTSP